MIKILLINKNRNLGSNLRKKIGDDKLVISLVLIAVGVILCFLYRTSITDVITTAVASLTGKITELFTSAT